MNLLNIREIACFIGALIFMIFPSLGAALILALRGSMVTWIDALIWLAVALLQWGLFYYIFKSYQ